MCDPPYAGTKPSVEDRVLRKRGRLSQLHRGLGAGRNGGAGLAAIGWIWFVVGLCLLLDLAEGSPPWRSAVALVCGVILAALFTRVDPSPEFFS
jgi:hypothetical protein